MPTTPLQVELVLLCDAPDRDAFLVERVSVLLGLGTHVNVTDEVGKGATGNGKVATETVGRGGRWRGRCALLCGQGSTGLGVA